MYVHDFALHFGGGVPGIISENSLQSAIARPYSGHYESLHEKAAAMVESIVRNHGFTDGNKRTAVLVLGVLVKRSGYECSASNEEVVDYMIQVARREKQYEDLLSWFREVLEEKSPVCD